MGISDYIRGIREAIGHDYLLLSGVTAIPRDSAGRVLLVRTVDFGIWGTVGGAVDPDESPADAIRREVREELGVDFVADEILGAFGGPGYRNTYPNGDRVGYTTVVFGGSINGLPTPDQQEIREVGWFAEGDLAGLEFEPVSRSILTDLGLLES